MYRFPTLFILSTALLSACTDPKVVEQQQIPGATVKLRLSEQPDKLLWTLGAAKIEFQALVPNAALPPGKTVPGETIATAQSDLAGTASLKLPGAAEGMLARADTPASAVFAKLFAGCSGALQSTDTQAQTWIGVQYAYIAGALSGRALAGSVQGGTMAQQILVFSTHPTDLGGQLSCGSTTYSLNFGLNAGWNLIEMTLDTPGLKVLTVRARPLDTVLQVTRVQP